MPRSGPTTLTLPPFTGATRRLILLNVAIFFVCALLGMFARDTFGQLIALLALRPAAVLHGHLWQLFTYEFLPTGLLGTLFGMLTLWFFGPSLEDRFGSRWLIEFYILSAAAGGCIASILAALHFLRLTPQAVTFGPWPPILALLVAFGTFAGEEQIRFNFIITLKVKYMVALYLLYYAAILFVGSDRLEALTCLSAALGGYAYMRFAPRRGLAGAATERYFSMRNAFYRAKRRRAAKKFSVYMGKQGREVNFDKDGRYIDPDADRDPNDKRWMN